MKKVLLTSLILGSSLASFAQNPRVVATSPGGAFDSFDGATEYSDTEGADPALGIYFWNDFDSTAVKYYKRDALLNPTVYNDGVSKSKKTRTGNGELSYVVSQAHGLFSPQVGVTFGAEKSLDLTGSPLTLKVGIKMDIPSLATVASATKGIKLKFSLKDANDVGIDAFGKLGGTNTQWKDELYVLIDKTGKFTISPDLSKTNPPIKFDAATTPGVTYVTVDFSSKGTDLGYEAVYPKLTDALYLGEDCVGSIKGDKGATGASAPKTGFDITKVAGFAMTFLQAEQAAGDCYFNTTLTNLPFALTDFNLGEITTGLEDDEVFNSNNVVSVYDMMGSFIATGKLKELNLTSGKLYIVKSGNKSKKIVMN